MTVSWQPAPSRSPYLLYIAPAYYHTMNKRKLLGYVIWLVAFLIPVQPSILDTEGVSNTMGMVSFVALVVLVFLGYFLVDGADQPKAEHGH